MNKKLMIGLALGALMLSVMACGIDLGSNNPMPTLMATLGAAQPTYTPYPTQVPPTAYPTAVPPTAVPPTAYPTAVPPTAVPQSGSMTQVLLNNGFTYYDSGGCGNIACESYTYRNGNISLNAVVSANGFGISAPMGSGYDGGGEGTVIGTVLAQAVTANAIPYAVAEWIINNMSNAQSSPTGQVSGYLIQITVEPNSSGVYFMNIIASK
jgi:hypothetical protein